MALHQPECDICARIERCRRGDEPALIAELKTGFAIMGDSQFFPGYALLLCALPATELDELPAPFRALMFEELTQLARAVRLATGAHKLNYEALGNIVHHLHWHIFPRRLTDPDPRAPVWGQLPTGDAGAAYRFDPARHGALRDEIARHLAEIRSDQHPSA